MIFRSALLLFCLHVAFGETNSSNVTNMTSNGTAVMVTTTVAADGFGTTTTAVATTTEAPTTTDSSTTSATSTVAPVSQNTSIYYLKGDKGDKGEQGDPGEDGFDGIDGIGVKGDKGEKGEDGLDGIDGRDGVDGMDGRNGRDAPTPVFDELEQSNKKIEWHQLDEDITFVISFGSTAFILALVNLTCTVWLCWKRLTRGDLNYAKLKETELKAMHMA